MHQRAGGTARVNAKTVTRIIVPFEGYCGRYVWHCHILEHEDNEMMRPYEVLPAQVCECARAQAAVGLQFAGNTYADCAD